MRDAEHITGGEEAEAEKGVSSSVFAIVICSVFLFIAIVGAYVAISDRLNGLDAYRTREMREQRDGYKQVCEENFKSATILVEWIRQQNLKPPPELLVQKSCVMPAGIEQKKDH